MRCCVVYWYSFSSITPALWLCSGAERYQFQDLTFRALEEPPAGECLKGSHQSHRRSDACFRRRYPNATERYSSARLDKPSLVAFRCGCARDNAGLLRLRRISGYADFWHPPVHRHCVGRDVYLHKLECPEVIEPVSAANKATSCAGISRPNLTCLTSGRSGY